MSHVPSERKAYTRQEAAELYGVSLSTLDKAIHSGALRARKVGRKYRIAAGDLSAWFDALPEVYDVGAET